MSFFIPVVIRDTRQQTMKVGGRLKKCSEKSDHALQQPNFKWVAHELTPFLEKLDVLLSSVVKRGKYLKKLLFSY